MKERKAARAMEHLDEKLVLAAMDESDRGEKTVCPAVGNKSRRNRAFIRWASVAAAFVLVFSAFMIGGNMMLGPSDAVVALDVNPGIEIEVNAREEIKAIRATTQEAEALLAGLQLEGKALSVGVDEIVDALVEAGYLSAEQNSILVSIDAGNSRTAGRLKEKVAEEITARLGGTNISASVITQDFRRGEGSGEKTSAARAALIEKIVAAGLLDAHGVPYTQKRLEELNVHELKLILDSKNFPVEGASFSGKANTGHYISAEQAMEAALSRAGLAAEEVERPETEMDYDDDYRAMVYEIEFCYGGNAYEYEISAENGTILEEEIEPVKAGHDELLTPPENAIAREEAFAAVLADAGVSAAEVKRPEIELDREDGVYVYEIEFKAGDKAYEYTVDAVTGEIREREIEPID